MKFALILALLVLVLWFWRGQRRGRNRPRSGSAKSSAIPQNEGSVAATEIVACSRCQLHLPRQDALLGKLGLYCSAAHKQAAGD